MSAPTDFAWGAATSAHQIEGGNEHNDWWAWEQEGRIEGGVRSGLATDHWNRWEEDLQHAKDLGLNSYRFSIEWSRIEPKEGQIDFDAIQRYRQILEGCARHGLKPMVTLHHFTSPLWFARQGGFSAPAAPVLFAKFVQIVVRELGAQIPLWCTFNEPMVLVVGTYLAGFMPPGTHNPAGASRALHGLLRSHALAYDIIHREMPTRAGPWKDSGLLVGIAHNLLDFAPDRRWHPLEWGFTRVLRNFYNHSWLRAIVGKKPRFSVPGIIPKVAEVPEALGRATADFIGINYYTRAYVQWTRQHTMQGPGSKLPIHVAFARPKEPVSDVDWSIHPNGLAKIIREVTRYGLPIYITENGIADREDKLRGEYIFIHLRAIAREISNGAPIHGYYYWSLLDNFEWIKGYGPRFGLYEVDYKTLARTARPSAHLFKKIVESHCSREAPSVGYFGAHQTAKPAAG